MSTYATLVWVDLRPDGPVTEIADGLCGLHGSDAVGGPQDPRVWIQVEPDWLRLTTYVGLRTGLVDPIRTMLSAADWGRAVVAEDHDELGACWTVLAVDAGITRVVHRRYILNADPARDRDVDLALTDFQTDGVVQDPRAADVAGDAAATSAALLFGVAPGPVVEAEAGSPTAFERLGQVGGPFPWLKPMGLPWPGPDAGRLLRSRGCSS